MSQDNRTTPPAPAEPQEVTEATLQALATSCAKKRGPADTLWQFDDLGLSIFISKVRGLAAPPPQQSAQGQAIYDAIDILTAEADSLRECHTSGDAQDDWTGEPEAKAEYDRMMRTVEGLRAMSAAQGDAAQGGGKNV